MQFCESWVHICFWHIKATFDWSLKWQKIVLKIRTFNLFTVLSGQSTLNDFFTRNPITTRPFRRLPLAIIINTYDYYGSFINDQFTCTRNEGQENLKSTPKILNVINFRCLHSTSLLGSSQGSMYAYKCLHYSN